MYKLNQKVIKKTELKLNGIISFILLVLVISSCSSDETLTGEEQQDYSEVIRSAEIDKVDGIMDDIAIKVFETQQESEETRTLPIYDLPACITTTVIIQQNNRQITIDFGKDGCLVRGNILKGKIILSYSRNTDAQTVFITKSLEDFYFNNMNIQGGKTILKEASNENGHPQFTKTLDVTVIWPNGIQASRSGEKVREWIEGHGSGVWSDNVFGVTGFWTTTFVNGNTHSYKVQIPLRREVFCLYIVKGSIDVERTNFSGVFNYGEGECDNMATFTFANGTVIDILLN